MAVIKRRLQGCLGNGLNPLCHACWLSCMSGVMLSIKQESMEMPTISNVRVSASITLEKRRPIDGEVV